MAGSQDYAKDSRNDSVVIYLNGAFVPRAEAKISVFDAGFALGDGVWEGLRLHRGRLLFLQAHLHRLFTGAAAIALDIGQTPAQIAAAMHETVSANRMTDGAHLRLMVTRGEKRTVNQDPRHAMGRPTIVITAEYKSPAGTPLNLATSAIRCTGADMFDMRLNSHSRVNLIRALLQAIEAGGDEALMLDPAGFVSSCNATNFFCVHNGVVLTSSGEFCFNGVTRANVLNLCGLNNIPLQIGQFTLDAAHAAEEAFVTGTMGGITPVRAIDGHAMQAAPGPITQRLRALYAAMTDDEAASA
jgi:branched-chain amino acid aminotransferase